MTKFVSATFYDANNEVIAVTQAETGNIDHEIAWAILHGNSDIIARAEFEYDFEGKRVIADFDDLEAMEYEINGLR